MPSAIGPRDVAERKRALRREMRAVRAAIGDRERRTGRVWERVQTLDPVRGAAVVMAYRSIGSELDTAPFLDWCRSAGKRLVLPDASPAAAPPDSLADVDVVVVPGLAFTADGRRLGQGGGWYDRVLGGRSPACRVIGVGFAEQLVDEIPAEPHDVRVDLVVTDRDALVAAADGRA